MKLDNLKAGDRVIVRNGAKGEQYAVIVRVGNFSASVHKWLMRGKRWTNPVASYPHEILRFATPGDVTKRQVKGVPLVRPTK